MPLMTRAAINLAPKQTVLRNLMRKLAPTYRRYFGEIARVQVNPTHCDMLTQEAENSLWQLVQVELAKTDVPVVPGDKADFPATCWLVDVMAGRRNFMHSRLPVSCQFAYVENGVCLLGAVYFPVEDVLVLAASGGGSMGPERLRVANRAEMKDTVVLLPWHTGDCAELELMEKAFANGLHTRKTGHTLFDVIDVAAGRADAAVATRLTPLEAMVAKLIMVEAGGAVSDLKGNELTAASGELLAANPKLQPLLLKALR